MCNMQVMDDSRKLALMQRDWADREEDIRRQHAGEMSRLREQVSLPCCVYTYVCYVCAFICTWRRINIRRQHAGEMSRLREQVSLH
jgi:hypothetical protein